MKTAVYGENVIESSWRLVVWEFMKRDKCVRFCAESSGILKSYPPQLQFGFFAFAVVPLLTSHLARPAPDAFGRVDEGSLYRRLRSRLGHDLLPLTLGAVAIGSRTLTTLTKQAFVS